MNAPPNPFWEFSVKLYQNNSVATACIALQDRHQPIADVDVNILLLCVWAATSGHGELEGQDLLRAVAAVTPWRRDVLLHLRTARGHLSKGVKPVPKDIAAELRAEAIHAELEAERIEQLLLVQLVEVQKTTLSPGVNAAEIAATSFARYFAHLGVIPNKEDDADLAAILEGAFPEEEAGPDPSLRFRR